MRTFTPATNERYCLSLAGQRRADMFYTLRFHVWNGFTHATASENMESRTYPIGRGCRTRGSGT